VRYAFAHRGGRAHGPDNTLETFTTALARGATGLETDCWLTADGVVVLDHDGVVRAARRTRRPFAELQRAELPAHVPSLDELYTRCGTDFDLAIDVKRPAVAAAIVAVARRHGATGRLWLVGDLAHVVPAWTALADDAHVAVSLKRWQLRPAALRQAKAAGAAAVNMRWPWWTRRWVRRARDAGLLAFGYDAQSAFALRRCARLGLDGVFSDHVDRMIATNASG
jgi:glycerophosphoryl diester phosphodiesterase